MTKVIKKDNRVNVCLIYKFIIHISYTHTHTHIHTHTHTREGRGVGREEHSQSHHKRSEVIRGQL